MTLTPAFIYSSCEYLLITCYVPETFLRTRDPQQVNRTDQNPLLSGDQQKKKKGHERTFWGEVIFCILVKVWVIEVYAFVKTCWMIPLTFMHVTLCKLCYQKYKRIAHKYWILVADMHSECLGVKDTNVCNLLWSETKNKMAWWLDKEKDGVMVRHVLRQMLQNVNGCKSGWWV